LKYLILKNSSNKLIISMSYLGAH